MRLFFAIALLASSSIGIGQTAPAHHAPVLDIFTEQYNNQSYGQIYKLFSDDMKGVLSMENTNDFFEGIQVAFGELTALEYLNYNAPWHHYKGLFVNGELSVNMSIGSDKLINGLSIVPFEDPSTVQAATSNSDIEFLADGDWYVYWGGETVEQNYHYINRTQKHALDLIVVDGSGKSFSGQGTNNQDYYAFGKKVYAPGDATVVFAVDGVPDNVPGVMNASYVPGNAVLLRLSDQEYILIAHLQQGTVAVVAGDKVSQGDILGKCGNSGNSSEPHIHIHMQDGPSLTDASGVKMLFGQLMIDGVESAAYAPVKGQIIARP